MDTTRQQKPFFTRPIGGSEIFTVGNTNHGTTGEVGCELCRTAHPERHPSDDSYITFTLIGRQGVLECCGAIIDHLYREWGSEFTSQRLDEFRQSPLDAEFGLLRIELPDAVRAWAAKANKAVTESSAAATALPV